MEIRGQFFFQIISLFRRFLYKLKADPVFFNRCNLYSSATNFNSIRLYQPELLKSTFLFPSLLDCSLKTTGTIPEILINILFIRIRMSYRIQYEKFGQTLLHESISASIFRFTPADNLVVPLFFPLAARLSASYLEKVTGVVKKKKKEAVYTDEFIFHAQNLFVTEIELPQAPSVPDFVPIKKGSYYRFYIALFDCHRFETSEYRDEYENMSVKYRIFWILGYFGGITEYELQWYPVYYEDAYPEDKFNRNNNRFTIMIPEKKSIAYHPGKEVVIPAEILSAIQSDSVLEEYRDSEGNPGLYVPDAKISVSFLNF